MKVVVVGGGLAGLSTGALLARDGHAVTVVERGAQAGGRASTMPRSGFRLNYGAHAWYVQGVGDDVLRQLEVLVEGRSPRFDLAAFASGDRRHPSPAGPWSLLTSSLFGWRDKMVLARIMGALPRARGHALHGKTLGQWLDQLGATPIVRRFVEAFATITTYTRPAAALDAEIVLPHLHRSMTTGVWYLDGGWGRVVDGLVAALARHGGVLRTGQSATALRIEGSRVAGVSVGDEDLAAEAVVVATPPEHAAALVRGTPAAARIQALLDVAVPAHAFCLDLGLKVVHEADPPFVYDLDRDVYLSNHSATASSLASHAGALYHALAYLTPEEAADADAVGRRRADVEHVLERTLAGWRERIIVERAIPDALVTPVAPLASLPRAARLPIADPEVKQLFFAGEATEAGGLLAEGPFASAAAVAGRLGAQYRLAAGH